MKEVKCHSSKSYIKALKGYEPLASEIVIHKIIEEKKGEFEDSVILGDIINDILDKIDIQKLYSHQVLAIKKIREGNHIVVATPTASGKTLVYNLPVFESIIKDENARALYLFPLKALARDQLESVSDISLKLGFKKNRSADIYDGDTSSYKRRKIRNNFPSIIISNPEMLHLSILPYHEKWEEFLKNLKFIVIDEVHTLRGVMGSNMAWVIRRLIRICNFYGSSPKFIFSSATIKNPGELCRDLTGKDVLEISGSGAPSGKKNFIMINGIQGASSAATALLHSAVYRKLRTIVYTRSRKMTELISMWVDKKGEGLKDKIASYRAGFLPEERREIEQRLASGDLLGVVSTSALELGIDIGSLDICILLGYPGSINSTWQRAGRVGRSGRESCIILVGGEDALDQYIMRYPDKFFEMENEPAVIFPNNPVIMEKHISCMASELPIESSEDIAVDNKEIIRSFINKGSLLQSSDGEFIYSPFKTPQRSVSLRGSGDQYKIVEDITNTIIGEIDSVRVFHETHPGAVYLHNGEHYLITDLLEAEKIVKAEKRRLHYFTRYRSEKNTEILDVYKTKKVFNTVLGYGKIRVTEIIKGFDKKLIRGQKMIGREDLDLPPVILETEGLWIEIPQSVYEYIRHIKLHFMGGIHALEHASIAVFPVMVMCDRNDIGGISQNFHPQIQKPAVFIYDGYSGGAGLTSKAYENFQNLLIKTHELISGCSCEDGCPACIHSPKCGSGNRPLDKRSALEILSRLFIHQNKDLKIDREDYIKDLSITSEKKELKFKKEIKSFCVLDIETRYSAQEVGGWMNCDKMEVSCVVLYDSRLDDYLTYYAKDIKKLLNDLQCYDLIIGFNIIRFDYKVLSGYEKFDFLSLNTLDILISVHEKLGYRLSLDHLSEHSLGSKKSGSGLDALKWWKEGNIDKIVKYCKKDVELTKDLYLFGKKNGYLIFQNKAKDKVRVPVNF